MLEIRRRIWVSSVAVLIVLAATGLSRAQPSGWCSDNSAQSGGWSEQEIHLISSPITVNAEIASNYETANLFRYYVALCISDRPAGAGGDTTGGFYGVGIDIDYARNGVEVYERCSPDTGISVAPPCVTGSSGAAYGWLRLDSVYDQWCAEPYYYCNSYDDKLTDTGPCLWILGSQQLPTCTHDNYVQANPGGAVSFLGPRPICIVQMVVPDLDPGCAVWIDGLVVQGGGQPIVQYYVSGVGQGNVGGVSYYCVQTPGATTDPSWSYWNYTFRSCAA